MLYHLYSKFAQRDIPLHRSQRYDDALRWLRDAGTGKLNTDLTLLTEPDGKETSTIRLWSKKQENHKW